MAQTSTKSATKPIEKPVIEIAFNSYLPSPSVLDSFVEIIRHRKFSFETKDKNQDHLDSKFQDDENNYSDSDFDEIDEEIESLLKQMEGEEKQARDSLYI